MKRFVRNVVFYFHLSGGVAAGLVILLMSATGVLLAFEQQLLMAMNSSYGHAPAPTEERLPVSQLLARAHAIGPAGAAQSSMTLYAGTERPVLVAFGKEGSVYIDPYTGTGGPAKGAGFFRTVTDLHRWLSLTGDWRSAGKAVTGAANLIFLLLILGGLLLWFPDTWRWAAVKLRLVPSLSLRGKARDWNWHHALGFWSLAPLILIAMAGAVISYTWASDLVYRAAGETPPKQAAASSPAPPLNALPPATTQSILDGITPTTRPVYSLDQASDLARGYVPGWRTLSFPIPKSPNAPIPFTFDRGTGRQPQHKATLTVYPLTGERLFETAAAQTTGRKLRLFFRFAHTGEYFGLPGQAVAALASAAACVLVYTGIALALRRLVRFLRPGRAAPAQSEI